MAEITAARAARAPAPSPPVPVRGAIGPLTARAADPVSSPRLVVALPTFSLERSRIVLDLQRRVGNAAVARLLEDSDPPARDPAPEIEAAPEPVIVPPAPVIDAEELVENVIAVIERYRTRVNSAALALLTGVLVAAAERGSVHEVWGPVAGLVLQARVPRRKEDRAKLPAALTTPDAIAALGRIIDTDRTKIVDDLFAALLAVRDRKPVAEGGGGREGDPSTAAEEWKELAPVHKYFPNAAIADYVRVRTNLLGTFGALHGGTAGALRRIKAFYVDEIEDGHLAGKTYPVHKDMAQALRDAEEKFKAVTKGTPTENFQLSYFGGLVIRPNVNDPARLSEHAVGAAVDLDAAINPNEPGFPFGLIENVTGENLRAGATGKGVDLYNVTRPERIVSYAEALREAGRIAAISSEFKAAFQTEEAMGAQMVEIAKRKGKPTVGASVLLEAALLAATEPGRAWAPPVPEPAPGGKARNPREAAETSTPYHERLAELVFPRARVDWVGRRQDIADTVNLFVDMWHVFTTTVVREDPSRAGPKKVPQPRAAGDPEKRARVDPKAVDPDLAQLAMHGFMNVPPELAAALVANDGGNLRWLGAGASETRDYMHFELRRPPEPPTR